MSRRISAVVILSSLCTASLAIAATPGYVQDFATNNGGFSSGIPTNWISSGGVGGASDGWLEVTTVGFGAGNLGVRTSGTEFTGNLTADGVTGFSFWLKDVGQDDPLEIHVGVGGAFLNFWQYTPAIVPTDQWQEFSVDFNPANWTRIIGSGTFADALTASDRLLFRHDLAPYSQQPDSIEADFGLDRVRVLPEPTTMILLLGGAALLRRSRR